MSEFEACIKRRGLVRFETGAIEAVAHELAAATQDLGELPILLEHGLWKRVTITAYYTMFHAARALVLKEGYAEKSHFCLGVAFRELHGATSEGRELASGLERARVLREDADYRSLYDETGARAAAEVAARFVAYAAVQLGKQDAGSDS